MTTTASEEGRTTPVVRCLWSILILAKRLDVDLADAFDRTMTELADFLDSQ